MSTNMTGDIRVARSSGFAPIWIIASNEFRRVVFDPLSIVVFFFVLFLVLLNAIGVSGSSSEEGHLSVTSLGFIFYDLVQYCAAVAVFAGALSMAGERSRHSLPILLTKPLYRRDVVLGKFLGLNAFLLIFVSAVYLAYAVLLFVLVGTPASGDDYTLRLVSVTLVLFLQSSLAMAIAMLAGAFFKKVLQATLVSVTLFFTVWYCTTLNFFGSLSLLSPYMLSFKILEGGQNMLALVHADISYMTWLNSALPYIAFIVLEIIVVLAVSCMVFIRSEEA